MVRLHALRQRRAPTPEKSSTPYVALRIRRDFQVVFIPSPNNPPAAVRICPLTPRSSRPAARGSRFAEKHAVRRIRIPEIRDVHHQRHAALFAVHPAHALEPRTAGTLRRSRPCIRTGSRRCSSALRRVEPSPPPGRTRARRHSPCPHPASTTAASRISTRTAPVPG